MRPMQRPRITQPGTPARSRWHSSLSEWVSTARPVEGGFHFFANCVASQAGCLGDTIDWYVWGTWEQLKEFIRLELQLRDSGFYVRTDALTGRIIEYETEKEKNPAGTRQSTGQDV